MPSRTSLDSSAPIMAPSNATSTNGTNTPSHSNRQSIFNTVNPPSHPLSLARSASKASVASRQTLSSETAQREIRQIEDGLDKLENKKLGLQRYVPSARKEEGMQAYALGAKLERALGRRLGGQDAVMRPRGQTLGESGRGEKGVLA